MALVLKDRVKETTTTVGTGTYTLAGAVTGFQSFSVIGNTNTTYYAITNGTDWEVGIGTYTLSGTTLSRDTILESSNSGNAVNWSAGTKEIFCTYPAERSMYVDGTTITPAISARLGFANLAQGSALSVLGVTGNATADNASIAAGTDHQVLRRSGTSVAFGSVALNQSAAVTGTLPVGNGGTGQSSYVNGELLIGNTTGNTLTKATLTAGTGISITNGNGSISIAATNNGTVTSITAGSGLSGGTITTTGTISVNTNGITDAMLRQSAGLSVIGRSASTTGNVADITAGTDHQVFRRSGSTVGFGAVDLGQGAAITGVLPAANGGTGVNNSTRTLTISTNSGTIAFPGAATTQTFPSTSQTIAGLGVAQTFTEAQTFRAANAIRSEAASTQDAVVIAGRAGGTSSYAVTITPTTLSASRTLTLPNVTGTVAVIGTAQTFTAAQTFRAANAIRSEAASTQDAIVIAGRAGGSNSYAITLTPNTLTANRTLTLPDPGSNETVGYINTPINSQSAAYTLVATDAGKTILHPITDNNARTFTIPANSSVPYAVGTVVTFVNLINTVTIAITTDTMYLAGDGSTGSRTLAAYGVATAVKLTSTSWLISGNGLT